MVEHSMSQSSAERPHRRFRFTLKTMFVVMTVLGVWWGLELNRVRERQKLLKELEATRAMNVVPVDQWLARFPPGMQIPPAASIPPVRRLFGDQAIQEIWYSGHLGGLSAGQLARLKELFPEAEVREIPLEPCHPGCFPRETLVATPTGMRLIEQLQPGDLVLAVSPRGDLTPVPVRSVFVTRNRLLEISTSAGILRTTETQPLCTSLQQVQAAGKLRSGEMILHYCDGKLEPVRISHITQTERIEQVFNVVLGDSQIFIAGSFLARSKPPFDSVAAQK